MARPSKYESHITPKLSIIAGWARDGLTDEEMAMRLGISRDTFIEYKKLHKEFSDILKNNKEYIDYQVEQSLLNSALEGNTTAQIFWLKNRRPKMWRDRPEPVSDDRDKLSALVDAINKAAEKKDG